MRRSASTKADSRSICATCSSLATEALNKLGTPASRITADRASAYATPQLGIRPVRCQPVALEPRPGEGRLFASESDEEAEAAFVDTCPNHGRGNLSVPADIYDHPAFPIISGAVS
jgi:hypothetical protein